MIIEEGQSTRPVFRYIPKTILKENTPKFHFFHNDNLQPESVEWKQNRVSCRVKMDDDSILLVVELMEKLKTECDFHGEIADATEFIFGERRETTGNGGINAYRGYLLIEPEQMYGVLQRLRIVGLDRRENEERLDFKIYQPEKSHKIRPKFSTQKDLFTGEKENKNPLGYYFTCMPQANLFVIYGDTMDEIKSIFSNLKKLNWDAIEKPHNDRWAHLKGKDNAQYGERIYEIDDEKFYTMELNSKPGHSYNQ